MKRRVFSWLANMLLVVFSLSVAIGACEMYLRMEKHLSNTTNADFPVYARNIEYESFNPATEDTIYGRHSPSKPFIRSIYNEKGELKQSNHVSINNYGWISRHDYPFKKSPDEYRIAMIGDSFTGTTTNERIWADTVQDLINKDKELLKAIGKKRVTVFNIGEEGAGFSYFYFPLSYITYRFSPDLTVINYITEDVFRKHVLPDGIEEDASKIPVKFPPSVANKNNVTKILEFNGVKVPVNCWDKSFPTNCTTLEWYIPDGRQYSKDEIYQIKKYVVDQLSWDNTVLSRKSFLLNFLQQYLTQAAPASISTMAGADDIERSVHDTVRMRRYLPNIILAHVPTFADMGGKKHLEVAEAELRGKFKAESFTLYPMEHWMPVHRDLKEIIDWYNLPHDGHWSNKGADLYAKAMYRVIRNKFLLQDFSCRKPFEYFMQAQKSEAQGGRRTFLNDYERAVQSLPANAAELYRITESYAECGFILDLYTKYTDALFKANRKSTARAYVQKIQVLQPQNTLLYALLLETVQNEKEIQPLILDLSKKAVLIADVEVRTPILLMMADFALKHRIYEEAKVLYTKVNTDKPNHFPAMMGLADIYLAQGEHQQALGYLQALIAQQPDNKELQEKISNSQKILGTN